MQEDETFLENNVLRRLYRVLTLPTPEMNPPASPATTTDAKPEHDM